MKSAACMTVVLVALIELISNAPTARADVVEYINIGSPPGNSPDSPRPENDCPPGSVPVSRTKTIRNNTGKSASDFHFYMFQNDRPGVYLVGAGVEVTGAFTSASLESGTDDNRRGEPPDGKHGAQVNLEGGTIPDGGTIRVKMVMCMNERNVHKLKGEKWTFPDDEPEDHDGPKKDGWRVKRPFPGGGGGNPGDPTGGGQGAQEDNGGAGFYIHTVCIENDDAEQTLLLSELKLLASMTLYADPANDIDWDNIAPIQNGELPPEPPVVIPPKSTWCYAFETTGSYVGGYVYKTYTIAIVPPPALRERAGDPVSPEENEGTHPVDALCSDPGCGTFPPPPFGACCIGPGCDWWMGTCVEGVFAYVCSDFYSGSWLGAHSKCPETNCQSEAQELAYGSSTITSWSAADDFRPAAADLTRVSWRSTWSSICHADPPDVNFQVRIYPTLNGIPDQPNPVFSAMIQPDGASNDGDATFPVWTYTAPIAPLALVAGQCYWLEIQAADATAECLHSWLLTNPAGPDEPLFAAAGNNYMLHAIDGVYDYGDARAADLTWCVDSGVVVGGQPGIDHGCGAVSVACCIDDDPNTPTVGDPTCVDNLDTRECVEFPYRGWPITDAICADNLCPGEPANDDFVNAESINLSSRVACNDVTGTLGTCQGDPDRICNVVDQDCKAADLPCVADPNTQYECFFEADNRQANRDGLKSTGSLLENSNCFPSGATSLQADVWYTLTNNTCTGDVEIRGCDGDYWYDTMVDLWEIDCNSPTIPTTSRNCPDTLPCRVGCEDDGCADYFDDRTVALATLANLSVESGKCYAFRVAAWASSTAVQADGDKARVSRGLADMSMRFLCQGGDAPAAPLAATGELGMSKQRYISWRPDPAETSSYAFSVEHPLSGREYYVSTPRTTPPAAAGRGITVLVSDASPILFNWSSQSIVHANGCMVAPGDQVNTGGAGHEYLVRSTADGVAFSAPLSVLTTGRPTDTRWWADVVGGFSAGSWTAPNGLMNGFDITAVFRSFQANPASPGPILERADLNPVQVDRVVNGQDVLQAVNAFGIAHYPFSVPQGPGNNGQASCPTPPTSGSLAP